MSALLTDRRPGLRRTREADCRARSDSGAVPGPTLDDVISRQWEVLRAGVPAACLVCGSELAPPPAAGAGSAGGRCDSCGTTLA